MKDIFRYYEEIDEIIYSLDYSDYKFAYEFALKVSKFSWEHALKVMINIIINDPMYFDETIRDSIYLYVDSEGNRSTYEYLEKCMISNKNEEVNFYLREMLENLRLKYSQRNLDLS